MGLSIMREVLIFVMIAVHLNWTYVSPMDSLKTCMISRNICVANTSREGISLVRYRVARPLVNSSDANISCLACPRTQNTSSFSKRMLLSSATAEETESAFSFQNEPQVTEREYRVMTSRTSVKTYSIAMNLEPMVTDFTYSFGDITFSPYQT